MAAKKKPVTIPAAYPYDGPAKPQVLKKGRPALNPQATKLSTAVDSAVGTVLGGLTGHRTAAQEKQHAALRQKSPGKAFDQDVNAALKTTTDFYKMRSPAPQPGAKAKKPAVSPSPSPIKWGVDLGKQSIRKAGRVLRNGLREVRGLSTEDYPGQRSAGGKPPELGAKGKAAVAKAKKRRD